MVRFSKRTESIGKVCTITSRFIRQLIGSEAAVCCGHVGAGELRVQEPLSHRMQKAQDKRDWDGAPVRGLRPGNALLSLQKQ